MSGHLLEHEGKVYSPDGLVDVPPDGIAPMNLERDAVDAAYATSEPERVMCYWDGCESVGCCGSAVTWLGTRIGAGIVTGRWRIPNGWISSHMISVRVLIGASTYHGRGGGNGMLLRLKKSKEAA